MQKKLKKALIVGLDGANPGKVLSLVSQGKLPNIARILGKGAFCTNTFAPYPTLTGSNWQTIATGAWPGTHGVTDMSYHVTGEPLNSWHSGFSSEACKAEYIWEALARVGKNTILLKYTGSWPPRGIKGIQVDGGGGRPFWGGSILELSHSLLFSTETYPNGISISLRKASGWDKVPDGSLETEIIIQPTTGNIPEFLQFNGDSTITGDPVKFHALLRPDGSFVLSNEKKVSLAVADVPAKKWSSTLIVPFSFNGVEKRAMFRFKVLSSDLQNKKLTLYITQIYPVDGFCSPGEIGAELIDKFGCFFNHPGFSGAAMGWFDDAPETFIEIIDMQNKWLAEAGKHLMRTNKWDLFMMQAHTVDFANHLYMPHHDTSPSESIANDRLLDKCYESVDRLIGVLTESLKEDVLIVIVSDHGATISPGKEVVMNSILEKVGLLSYEHSDAENAVRRKVDMTRTKAIQQRSPYIYVNLKDRDPDGIVNQVDYEKVREQIIDTLYSYRDPETGRSPFSLVFRKEDARILGLWDSFGRDIGDIVYALYPEFDHEHGRQLPSACLGGQDMRSFLAFAGSGVRQGALIERNAWLVDLVPTVAVALGWPMPADVDGAVLYQVFSGMAQKKLAVDQGKKEDKTALGEKIIESLRKQISSQDKRISELESELAKKTNLKNESKVCSPADSGDLRAALQEARVEAKRWKTAYERYHKITHGN